jgi:hypothetical protein
MSDNQPTTIKEGGPTRIPHAPGGYPGNDPSPHGQGESDGATAPISPRANLTRAESGDKKAADTGPKKGTAGDTYPHNKPTPYANDSRRSA